MEGAVHTPPKQTFGAEQFPTLWPLTVQASPSAIALLRHWDDLNISDTTGGWCVAGLLVSWVVGWLGGWVLETEA